MSNVEVPDDRTIKQQAVGFCRNPECRTRSSQEFTFPVEHAQLVCPKCKADKQPMVGLLTLTHLLLKNPAGPISGYGGIRWNIACDSKRAYLATATNLEAVSGDPNVVNCNGCLLAAEQAGAIKPKVKIADLIAATKET